MFTKDDKKIYVPVENNERKNTEEQGGGHMMLDVSSDNDAGLSKVKLDDTRSVNSNDLTKNIVFYTESP